METEENFGTRLADLRYTNARGQIIPLHHAFLTLRMHSFSRISAIVLPIFFLALIWFFLPMIMTGWGAIFEFWMQKIYGGHISTQSTQFMGQYVNLPIFTLEAADPTDNMVRINLIVCVVSFVLSFLMPGNFAPFNYLVRSALIIQASASLDRLISPDFFPYTLQLYLHDSLSLSVYLVFLLPVTLGFVYYIFDFGLWRKLLLTALMHSYFFVAIPCQYMLHAYIIHEGTLLFLPILYLLFGPLLDVMMFVSIYALGMSWHNNTTARQGRNF